MTTDQSNSDNHVVPLLGHLRVKDVTRKDIEAFKLAVSQGKAAKLSKTQSRKYRGGNVLKGGTGAANRCLALLSKMFNMAEAWGWREENTNPVRLVKKYAENKRQRFLTVPEIEQLLGVLDDTSYTGNNQPLCDRSHPATSFYRRPGWVKFSQ